MRADYEQLPEDTGYPLNAAFNEDEDQEAEPSRRPPTRSRPRDEPREDYNEPRSNYYYVDRERSEYPYASPRPRVMIQSTKPNYTRWPQPAEIEKEDMPEGEDPDNPNYTRMRSSGQDALGKLRITTKNPQPTGPRGPMVWQRVGSLH